MGKKEEKFEFDEDLKSMLRGNLAKKFKKKILGTYKRETKKSTKELINILENMGITELNEKIEKVIENLNRKYLIYSSSLDLSNSTPEHKCLYFERVNSKDYKIKKSILVYGEDED